MAFRLQHFILFFCLLFSGGTLLINDGNFSLGTTAGALLTAGIIASIVKPSSKR